MQNTALVVIVVSIVVGCATYFLAPREVVPIPLTYEVPIHIESQTLNNVTFHTKRCNNTGEVLKVSVTAMWESSDRREFIPLQPITAGVVDLPPGCIDMPGNPVNTAYVPNGTWRLRGSICYVDFCGGFYSDFLTIAGH